MGVCGGGEVVCCHHTSVLCQAHLSHVISSHPIAICTGTLGDEVARRFTFACTVTLEGPG